SLGLIVCLLGSLLFVYRTTARSQRQADQLLWPIRQRLALQERLHEVMLQTAYEHETGFAFAITEEPALVFSYHNGIDLDRQFCGIVLGKLYCDDTGRLILASWPNPNKEHDSSVFRQEILIAGVEEFSVEGLRSPTLEDILLGINPPMIQSSGDI